MDHFEKQEAEHLPTTVTDEDIANAIEDEHGAKYSPDGKRLLQGADIKAYAIKEGTEVICDEAFRGCTSLEQINIPDSVTSIGDGAFWSCESLEQITIPSSVSAIEGNPFAGCKCTITCHSPHFKVVDNVLYNSDLTKLFSYLSTQSHFTIPDNVTSIGDSAFEGCSSLRQIYIPDGVTSIGRSAFFGCESLQQIYIPDGVTSIRRSAFSWCESLQQIYIPDGVTSIGRSAFWGCTSLRQIYIPAGSREKFERLLPNVKDKLVEAGD